MSKLNHTTIVEHDFNIADTVFLKVDVDQRPRIIVAIILYEDGIMYKLVTDSSESFHYEYEISKDKNFI